MIEDYIENNKSKIIKNTQELIKIPSVYNKSNDPCMPFGKNINDALKYTLNLGKKLGFRTKNIDGYCGYLEFGSGEELIGIIGHLDVVPEGKGWTFPPFSATIVDNKIFGRGSIDDKGPVISSIYAMKSVMENYDIHKRVRLILGLNEENDWKCIEHYKKTEEPPIIGFSPDADFPCIYAEKSILSCYLTMKDINSKTSYIKIKEIDCNNNPLNVVPKFCSITLEIDNEKIPMSNFIEITQKIIQKNNFEIDIYKISNQEIKLTSHGIQAHAAHPDLGTNAISQLIICINQILVNYTINLELFDFFSNYIGLEYNGKSLGIDFEDESGKLTLNIGNLDFKNLDSELKIGLNIRIPINTSVDTIKKHFITCTSKYSNINFYEKRYQPALHISQENILVKTLCDVFNKSTNSNFSPIAIGGATYARAFKNCISFGPNFPGQTDMCHQVDEFIEIDNLILCSKIYAKAIYALTNI